MSNFYIFKRASGPDVGQAEKHRGAEVTLYPPLSHDPLMIDLSLTVKQGSRPGVSLWKRWEFVLWSFLAFLFNICLLKYAKVASYELSLFRSFTRDFRWFGVISYVYFFFVVVV